MLRTAQTKASVQRMRAHTGALPRTLRLTSLVTSGLRPSYHPISLPFLFLFASTLYCNVPQGKPHSQYPPVICSKCLRRASNSIGHGRLTLVVPMARAAAHTDSGTILLCEANTASPRLWAVARGLALVLRQWLMTHNAAATQKPASGGLDAVYEANRHRTAVYSLLAAKPGVTTPPNLHSYRQHRHRHLEIHFFLIFFFFFFFLTQQPLTRCDCGTPARARKECTPPRHVGHPQYVAQPARRRPSAAACARRCSVVGTASALRLAGCSPRRGGVVGVRADMGAA